MSGFDLGKHLIVAVDRETRQHLHVSLPELQGIAMTIPDVDLSPVLAPFVKKIDALEHELALMREAMAALVREATQGAA